jgi:1,4-alpha-glucan branching enzyme
MNKEKSINGMGAIPHAGGVAFCVWAPHAQQFNK